MTYFVLKYLHIVGASVLLGTGSGIAFFMLVAHIQGKPAVIAAVGRIVVLADFVFTASAVVVQPVTGLLLVWTVGYSITEGWIMWSLVLYVFTGLFWPITPPSCGGARSAFPPFSPSPSLSG
jgi:uncharacterized membrane protein